MATGVGGRFSPGTPVPFKIHNSTKRGNVVPEIITVLIFTDSSVTTHAQCTVKCPYVAKPSNNIKYRLAFQVKLN